MMPKKTKKKPVKKKKKGYDKSDIPRIANGKNKKYS